jgi:tetratricopeptide (TPR) repeat protein
MKWWFSIGIVLMAVMVGCKPPTTSPLPSPGGEGVASRTLENIDSLMWRQPDSALTVMLEFAGSAEADSLDEFNGHYCQVLVAELLFKNDYGQSNREELLEAVSYFDSLIIADERSESEQDRNAFLDARAHYINGVGYAEKDSVVEACGEYLCALRTMESHYPENELVGTKARFMVLTYNRLVDLFSDQYMPESVIICSKQALHYDAIEPLSPTNRANVLYRIGTHYDMLKEADSAAFYYEAAMKAMTGRNSLVYRDLISSMAYHEYSIHHDTMNSFDSLKRMATLSVGERERLIRFLTIGAIYHDMGQYDSAKVYLEPVLENSPDKAEIAAGFLRDIAISEADTLKTEQYARLLVKDASKEVESQARVSKLNDIFQQHLQWEQERADAERQGKARVRRNRMIVATGILAVLAALTAWLLHRRKMKEQREEANQQIEVEREAHRLESQKLEAEREAHRLEKASMSGRLKKSNQEVRELKDQIKRQEEVNAKPQQAESFTDEPICRLILERVHEGQFKAQMDCKLYKDAALSKEQVTALRDAVDRHFNLFAVRLAKAYPNLTKNDLDYCCLYLLGLSDADISALMQRAYTTVNDRGRKMKAIFGAEEPLSVTLRGFAEESTSN